MLYLCVMLHNYDLDWDYKQAMANMVMEITRERFKRYNWGFTAQAAMPLYSMSQFKEPVIITSTGGAFKWSTPF